MSRKRPESYMEPGDAESVRRKLQIYRRRQQLVRIGKTAGKVGWGILGVLGEAAKIVPGYPLQPNDGE